MKNNITLSLVILSVLLMSGCKKDLLDLSSGTYFDVKTFLKSKNCDTDCKEKATCEGKEVKLRAVIDIDNIIEETSSFFINDANSSKYNMNVTVEEAIKIQAFDKIKDFGSKVIEIEGVIKGFDAPTNTSCDRKFGLTLSDIDKITLEK